jgi:hypothetical protein
VSTSAVFFLAYAGFALAGIVPFYLGRNVAFKRRYYPWYLMVAFGLFWAGGSVEFKPVVAIVWAFICAGFCYLTFKNTSFCDCGLTVWGRLFDWRDTCPECRALLPEWR